MMFKSKIKWVALGGLVLSLLSLFVHMFLANTSVELVQYHVITGFVEDLNVNVVGQQVMFALDLMFCRCLFTINCNCLYVNHYFCSIWLLQRVASRKLWKKVKPLEDLQPYANPRNKYPGNKMLFQVSSFLCAICLPEVKVKLDDNMRN